MKEDEVVRGGMKREDLDAALEVMSMFGVDDPQLQQALVLLGEATDSYNRNPGPEKFLAYQEVAGRAEEEVERFRREHGVQALSPMWRLSSLLRLPLLYWRRLFRRVLSHH